MHGKTSSIRHNEKDLFQDMPQGFPATRYHSLVIERTTLPECLEITATSEDNEIMGIRHRELPVWGLQFHPESLATENGIIILKNFLNLANNLRRGPTKSMRCPGCSSEELGSETRADKVASTVGGGKVLLQSSFFHH